MTQNDKVNTLVEGFNAGIEELRDLIESIDGVNDLFFYQLGFHAVQFLKASLQLAQTGDIPDEYKSLKSF